MIYAVLILSAICPVLLAVILRQRQKLARALKGVSEWRGLAIHYGEVALQSDADAKAWERYGKEARAELAREIQRRYRIL